VLASKSPQYDEYRTTLTRNRAMPLKLAPYRPQQLALAIGVAILLASGTLLGSSAAVAQVITDMERNAEPLQPELPAALNAAPADQPAVVNLDDDKALAPLDPVLPVLKPAEAASTGNPVETPPIGAAASPLEAAPEPILEMPVAPPSSAPERPEPAQQTPEVAANPDPHAGKLLEVQETELPMAIQAPAATTAPVVAERTAPIAEPTAVPPLAEPVQQPPEVGSEAPAMAWDDTDPDDYRTPKNMEPALPESTTNVDLAADKQLDVLDPELPMGMQGPAPTAAPVIAERTVPATTVPPTAPPAPRMLSVVAEPATKPARPASPAAGLRVYYASGNTDLSAREKRAVESFCGKVGAKSGHIVEVHVSMPSPEAIRVVALRQDALRALFRSQGINGEQLRFRMTPYASNAPGSPGVPLAPHYAEFRLIESL